MRPSYCWPLAMCRACVLRPCGDGWMDQTRQP
jgi:hypothetical protein